MPSLYIHIPFCERKCLFCSFVVSIGQEQRIDQYLKCLKQEAQKHAGTEVQTIYVGGGTPSLLNTAQLAELSSIIRENFHFKNDTEMTMEANPENIDPAKGKLLLDLGFNRISLGVQSLNDRYLKMLGRCHDSARARSTFKDLRKMGWKNVSLDLMYAFPEQTEEELKDDVRAIASLESEHLSIYSLTIEEPSRFYVQSVRGSDDWMQADFYQIVSEGAGRFGFKQYEISNFAKLGKESLHNRNYWLGGNYIGLGVGAHGHRNGRRFWNVARLMEYINRIEENKPVEAGEEILNTRQQFIERLLFGLRMNEGVNLNQLQQEWNCSLDQQRTESIHRFVEQGFLVWEQNILKATRAGQLVLDELCARLV